MIRLSRAEQARLDEIRKWVTEQRRLRLLADSDPTVKALLAAMRVLLPDKRPEDAIDTPLSHVNWLLKVIERDGVQPR